MRVDVTFHGVRLCWSGWFIRKQTDRNAASVPSVVGNSERCPNFAAALILRGSFSFKALSGSKAVSFGAVVVALAALTPSVSFATPNGGSRG